MSGSGEESTDRAASTGVTLASRQRQGDAVAPKASEEAALATVLLAEDDTDGQQALDLWAELSPDLLVLDVMMPHLTGLEVLARVRAGNGPAASVPVLVLSARVSESDIVAGFELGVSDYVTKPFMVGELRARVRALLGRP